MNARLFRSILTRSEPVHGGSCAAMAPVATGRDREPGLIVRDATVDDARAMAQVYVETARAQYGAIVGQRVLQQLPAQHVARRWELLLTSRRWVRSACVASTGNGRVVGFAAAGPARIRSLGAAGEVYAIYVLPPWQRLGLGRRLFGHAVESLAPAGLDAIVAWVFAANASRGFFEALGATAVAGASVRSGLTKVAYRWHEPGHICVVSRVEGS